MAKIRETTLAHDDEISRNIAGLARTRPDIFGATEEKVSSAVNAEIEKKKEEQAKQVIWDGHTRRLPVPCGERFDSANNEARNVPGLAPPPNSGMPSVRPLPPPLGLASNIPPIPTRTGILTAPLPRMPVMPMIPPVRPQPPTLKSLTRLPPMARSPISLPISVAIPSVPVPPPPGSQFRTFPAARPFAPMHIPPSAMPPTVPQPPLPQGIPSPPPEEAPPPLPGEPEPKRQRVDDTVLIPEDQFMAQHPGSVGISVSVPNGDEGKLNGQILEISMQPLAETIGSLKQKLVGEVQLPANKQKLSGHAGFLQDNISLAYYNIGPGETQALSLRERGGRKR